MSCFRSSCPTPSRPARFNAKTSDPFSKKLAEFIHPGPDSPEELIEALADAEENKVINAESQHAQGVIRLADTAGDVYGGGPAWT